MFCVLAPYSVAGKWNFFHVKAPFPKNSLQSIEVNKLLPQLSVTVTGDLLNWIWIGVQFTHCATTLYIRWAVWE
jgi:hypothetical protein